MKPTIICEQCGKEVLRNNPKATSQIYCKECAELRLAEYNRRHALATYHRNMQDPAFVEKMREKDRKRRSTSEGKRKHCDQSMAYYARMKSDPDFRARKKAIDAKAIDKWLDKRDFGGNWYKVFERDGGKCQTCGSTEKLVVHHKDGKGTRRPQHEKNNAMDNLILLCNRCHTKLHQPWKDIGSKSKSSKPG